MQASHLADGERHAPVGQIVEVVADRLDGEHRREGVPTPGGGHTHHHRRRTPGVKAFVRKRPQRLSAKFRIRQAGSEGAKVGKGAGGLRQEAKMFPEGADHEGLVGRSAKKPIANPAMASAACQAAGDLSTNGMTCVATF